MSDGTMEQTTEDLVDRLADVGRQLGLATVMFHAVIAEQVGLSVTAHKCLDLVARANGPLTVGRIAELSGLSTGAATGVVDQLERQGYVRRVRDAQDRRRVLVELCPHAIGELGPRFGQFRSEVDKLAARFARDELVTILRFLDEAVHLLRMETGRMRAGLGTSARRARRVRELG
ncbi:DNA-binding transcriptional regulator, MarR family [Amycolatopsis arida]|uniref:DNA-binding transcriptional regulator, MarR family n=1 Tax=Amycolatopsis arida TaxID=587909 RepID=A0A1I5VAC0_9PSEU|nr:MarR family transcriptional regulator [Amycolatopsis arida]TDX91207.1 DNA-binding MarR family transcriptional regulator [Amycolatopsis arida]SFQ04435.1 DNA-binding transcriptional regulator, MarR family [Amycolatopsis arida]